MPVGGAAPVPSAALDFGPRAMTPAAKDSFADATLANCLPPIPLALWVRHTPTACSFPAQIPPIQALPQWLGAPSAPIVTIPTACFYHMLFRGGVQVPIPANAAPLAIDLGEMLYFALYA